MVYYCYTNIMLQMGYEEILYRYITISIGRFVIWFTTLIIHTGPMRIRHAAYHGFGYGPAQKMNGPKQKKLAPVLWSHSPAGKTQYCTVVV